MKHSAEIVLKGLLQERVIELPKLGKIMLAENGQIASPCTQINLGTEEKSTAWVVVDITLAGFIRICETLSQEEIFNIGADNALNDIKKKRTKPMTQPKRLE